MSRNLIVYFSRPGENYSPEGLVRLRIGYTAYAASVVESLAGGDVFRIDMAEPYPEEYAACCDAARAHLEQNARPALARWPEPGVVEECRTLILCYPNYWGTAPMPVLSFLEACDWSGRTILPLCTHGGGGAGRSAADIAAAAPGAEVKEPLALPGHEAAGAKLDIQLWLSMHGVRMEEE